jgi:hypothetical protein
VKHTARAPPAIKVQTDAFEVSCITPLLMSAAARCLLLAGTSCTALPLKQRPTN